MRLPHAVLQKRRERLRDRSSTTPSQSSSAHTPSRDISSARITSIIAIAVSTVIRVTSGASDGTACTCQSNGVVAHQLRNGPGVGEHRVDQLDRAVTVAGEQLAQHRPQRAHGVELGPVAVAATGVAVLGVPLVELLDGGQRVRRPRAVDQGHGRLQGHLGVMSENHVDRLPRAT